MSEFGFGRLGELGETGLGLWACLRYYDSPCISEGQYTVFSIAVVHVTCCGRWTHGMRANHFVTASFIFIYVQYTVTDV